MNNPDAYMAYLRQEIADCKEREANCDEVAEFQAGAYNKGRWEALSETLADLERYFAA